jgi:hypothetical protein
MSGMELVFSDRNGVYIPQYFAQQIDIAGDCWEGYNNKDIEILLAGPDHEHYWDAWDSVLGCTRFIDSRGRTWYLYQDGDLWIYNEELMTDEEYRGFFGEPRERSHELDFDADCRWETDNWYDTSAELM